MLLDSLVALSFCFLFLGSSIFCITFRWCLSQQFRIFFKFISLFSVFSFLALILLCFYLSVLHNSFWRCQGFVVPSYYYRYIGTCPNPIPSVRFLTISVHTLYHDLRRLSPCQLQILDYESFILLVQVLFHVFSVPCILSLNKM